MFQNLAPILVFWKKLNKGQEWLHTTVSKSADDKAPLICFINDEKKFSLKLIQIIHKSLSAISRIIRGMTLPTKKDVDIAKSLSTYHVSIEV